MTTRRGFFGWLAGAAAAPAVVRGQTVDAVGFAHGGMLRRLPVGALVGEWNRPITRSDVPNIREALRNWDAIRAFMISRPEPVCAPKHYVRAPLHFLRGLPEHVARQKRPRRRRA